MKSTHHSIMCGGKETFSERTLADRVAARMRRADKTVRAYACPVCRHWHVGSKP